MNLKNSIGIIVLIGIVIALAFIAKPHQPDAVAGVAVVTYTNDGFSPESVTIKKGEVVRFVNESSRPFWPASDPHPIHTLYPEKAASDCLGSTFDACKPIPSGESWEFTFNKIGEWSYHNHLSAGDIGFVVVR